MAYFMTHLMYREQLATLPLYEVDYSELAKVAKPASPYVMATLAQYNLCLFTEALPLRVFLDCGLDFDRRADFGLKQYPRNSNCVFGYAPLRLPSLQ